MSSERVPPRDDFAEKERAIQPRVTAVKRMPGRRTIAAVLSILGGASLCYLLGAAVMYFELPSSTFLQNAFVGGQAWYEHRQSQAQTAGQKARPLSPSVAVDQPGQTCDGFTLCMVGPGTRAFLLNMHGDVVHEWTVPFSQIWPNPPHVPRPLNDSYVFGFGGYLYRNGDLLFVLHGDANPANGYGLVKVDKDSHILWKYAENAHHDVDVGEDGTIYAIKQRLIKKSPKGLEFLPTPCIVDSVVVLNPDGVERDEIPILEAFQNSPYAPLLSVLETPSTVGLRHDPDDAHKRDVLHTNCVQVLSQSRAPAFPQFKVGQILFSMKHLDTIGVLDPERRLVVWAARGPWKSQHDPQFLDNGHLLLFDNLGSPRASRVLEYDPRTQGFPWSYRAAFVCPERGMSQRLPNGNTLIADTTGAQIVEVSAGGEIVWSCTCAGMVHLARRYSSDELHFLEGKQGPRPSIAAPDSAAR
jgi:hypothetical protein